MIEQQAGKQRLVAQVERLVQRVPTPHPLKVEFQIIVGQPAVERGEHLVAVEPPSRHGDRMIEITLRLWTVQQPIDPTDLAGTALRQEMICRSERLMTVLGLNRPQSSSRSMRWNLNQG